MPASETHWQRNWCVYHRTAQSYGSSFDVNMQAGFHARIHGVDEFMGRGGQEGEPMCMLLSTLEQG